MSTGTTPRYPHPEHEAPHMSAALAELFQPVTNSDRVQCRECGTRGMPGGKWQTRHLNGHVVCPTCGRVVIATRGRPDHRHRCRPKTVAQRAIDEVARILAAHRRDIDPTGLGVLCHCGLRFGDLDAWDHHRADLATDAAARILTP